MKQKFIEWFIKNNNGCSPAMEDDRNFVCEKTQHMFEAYQAGVAQGEARCAALAAENAGLKATAILLADEANQVYRRWNLIQQPDGDIVDMQTIHELLCACHETPATDAFLAEVRAQGVEMLNTQFKKCTGMLYADSVVSTAEHFAVQLRKGVQS
ncbi:hypothetical protein [Enterobacter asburiae]|uniref:hypothetical protein n=1 Tax=Enterobacter asburiae TaxID=61645 RepID=UPI0034D2CDB8